MFQLTEEEWKALRFQNGIIKKGRGEHTKYFPYAFTEQGLAMLSGLLNSDLAIQVNITIMRAFVVLRQQILTTTQISSELAALKTKLELLERNEEENLEAINDLSEDVRHEIDNIYMAIAALSAKPADTPDKPARKIGFK